ncbi:MAG: redoxin family protein [Synergistaceae bacterium]|jgi:thiol-disulfide isomerase/thioredoxin|nr:redoxin family protein [Synergistaceae bacterium]
MKKLLLGIAVVLLVSAWGTQYEARAGELFPAFSSQTLDGATVTNAIFAEKKLTMINIWATWCGPCISEMPELGVLARSMPEGTQLIGLLEDVDAIDKAKTIVAQANADFPHVLLVDAMMPYLGAVYAIPWTIFVDSKGEIVGEPLIGSRTAASYRRAIENILDQRNGSGNAVTLRVDGAGGRVATDKATAAAGETVTLTLIPDSGYEFDSIWGYATGDENTEVPLYCSDNICAFTMPSFPVTVVVSFKSTGNAVSYPVILPVSGTGGGVTADKPTATAGETVTLTLTPDIGYEFDSIWVYETGNESEAVPFYCSGNICTFVMPSYSVTVTASFKRTSAAGYPVILLVNGVGGRATTDKTSAVAGENVTLTLIPDSGYEFDSVWGYETGNPNATVPLYCSGNICTFIMPSYSVTITASFKRTSNPTPSPSPIVPSPSPTPSPNSGSNGSGGGCDAFGLGVGVLVLAGAALLRKNGKR